MGRSFSTLFGPSPQAYQLKHIPDMDNLVSTLDAINSMNNKQQLLENEELGLLQEVGDTFAEKLEAAQALAESLETDIEGVTHILDELPYAVPKDVAEDMHVGYFDVRLW